MNIFTCGKNINSNLQDNVKPNRLIKIDKSILTNDKETIYSLIEKNYEKSIIRNHGKNSLAIELLFLLRNESFNTNWFIFQQTKFDNYIFSLDRNYILTDEQKEYIIKTFSSNKKYKPNLLIFFITNNKYNELDLFNIDENSSVILNKLGKNIKFKNIYLIDNQIYNLKLFEKGEETLDNINSLDDYKIDDSSIIDIEKPYKKLQSDIKINKYKINFTTLCCLPFFQDFRDNFINYINNNNLRTNIEIVRYIREHNEIFISERNEYSKLIKCHKIFRFEPYMKESEINPGRVLNFIKENVSCYDETFLLKYMSYKKYILSLICYFNLNIICWDSLYEKITLTKDNLVVEKWTNKNNDAKIVYKKGILTFTNYKALELNFSLFFLLLNNINVTTIRFINCTFINLIDYNTDILESVLNNITLHDKNFNIEKYYPRHIVLIDSFISNIYIRSNSNLKVIFSRRSIFNYNFLSNFDHSLTIIKDFDMDYNELFYSNEQKMKYYKDEKFIIDNKNFNYKSYALNMILTISDIFKKYMTSDMISNFEEFLDSKIDKTDIISIHKSYENLTNYINNIFDDIKFEDIKEVDNCNFCQLLTDNIFHCDYFICKCCLEKYYDLEPVKTCPCCRKVIKKDN